MSEPISAGGRIRQRALATPDEVAVTFLPHDGGTVEVTCEELERRSNQVARLLDVNGVRPGDRVGLGIRNSPEHLVAALAAWKIGAGIVTMRWDVPAWERDRLLEVAGAHTVLGEYDDRSDAGAQIISIDRAGVLDGSEVEIVVPPIPPIAIPTGGSTGASKAVLLPTPTELAPGMAFAAFYATFGVEQVSSHIVMGPLYHANPLLMAHTALFDAQHLVLMERFNPQGLVDAIREHRPQFMTLAPTMMRRLLEVAGIEELDFSCFRMILHTTAPCPAWLKRRWIQLVGGELLWETFASSELVGSIIVRGDEWLEHPGTIGRPAPGTELRLLDDGLQEVAVGEVGEVYMRLEGVEAPLFDYLGPDAPKVIGGGFVSVGDLAYRDAEGYVYCADRRTDLIITGGANVVPAEVEAALGEHPEVDDVAVIGLPDEDWGHRVHAIVAPRNQERPPSAEQLREFAKSRLSAYKVPKSFELVDALPRSEMFKIRRSALVAERVPSRAGR